MKNLTLMKMMFNPRFIGAVDFWKSTQKAAQNVQDNLGIIAPMLFVVSLLVGAMMFGFGKRGAESGKSQVWLVMQGVVLFIVAASLITTLFTLFGQTPQGIR